MSYAFFRSLAGRRILVLSALLSYYFFSAGSVLAQAGKADIEKKTQKTVIDTLSFKSVSIEKALDTISEKGGIVIKKVDIPKDTPPVTFEAKYISALEAIKIVTSVANLTYIITDEGVVVSRRRDEAGMAAPALKPKSQLPIGSLSDAPKTGDQTSSLLDKMARIIIPEIQFRQARMEDVVSFLNEASVTFDTITPVGQKKGVALLLYPPGLPRDEFAKWKEPSITLTARSISVLEVLRIVTESAGLTYWAGKEYARDCVRICRAGEKPPDSFRPQGVRQPAKTAWGTPANQTCDLVIPEVDFRHASLSNVVEVLTAAAKLHDPEKTGVRFIVEGPKTHSAYITLSARDVTLRDVLMTISEDTGMSLQIESGIDGQVVRLISGENTEGKKREPRKSSKAFDK